MSKIFYIQIYISVKIRDLTNNDIGHNLGTLGRDMEHWADIEQTLGGHWEDIWQTFQFSHAIKDFWILSCNIRLFGLLIQDKTFRFSYPR